MMRGYRDRGPSSPSAAPRRAALTSSDTSAFQLSHTSTAASGYFVLETSVAVKLRLLHPVVFGKLTVPLTFLCVTFADTFILTVVLPIDPYTIALPS